MVCWQTIPFYTHSNVKLSKKLQLLCLGHIISPIYQNKDLFDEQPFINHKQRLSVNESLLYFDKGSL